LLPNAEGWISEIDANTVGQAVVDLGGGRKEKDDEIDYSVGVELHVEVGSPVEPGQPAFTVHAADESAADRAVTAIFGAIRWQAGEVATREPILRIL
jgi:thymidine phosphorylase